VTRLQQLVEDEGFHLSAARVGMWLTVLLAFATVGIDAGLTIARAPALLPNTIYGLEGTMFVAFASWAAGPRIAEYLAPQLGAVVQGLASAVRDSRLPSKHDDERGDPQ